MLRGKQVYTYTAGIIDGEGCISIAKHMTKTVKRGFTYDLIVSVWNTELWLIQWLKMQFGGGIVTHGESWQGTYPSKKKQWRWAVSHRQAAEFLKLVLPYLQFKRPHAEIAISFQTKNAKRGKTEKDLVVLEAERILLSKMNAKGGRRQLQQPIL